MKNHNHETNLIVLTQLIILPLKNQIRHCIELSQSGRFTGSFVLIAGIWIGIIVQVIIKHTVRSITIADAGADVIGANGMISLFSIIQSIIHVTKPNHMLILIDEIHVVAKFDATNNGVDVVISIKSCA